MPNTETIMGRDEMVLPKAKVKANNANDLKLLRAESGLDEKMLLGVEVIGAGYNPFLDYASASSVTIQLFAWETARTKEVIFKPGYKVPDVVDAQQADTATYTNVYGTTIDEYQRKLASSVKVGGGYNLFSGSIDAEYTFESVRSSQNEYTRIQQSINMWSLRLPIGPTLRDHLRPEFRDLLDALPLTPDAVTEFFNRYGSHFLAGVVMGGRAVYTCATNKSKVSRTYAIETTAQASYQALTGQLSAEAKTKYSQSISSLTQTSEVGQFIVGGDGVKAASAFEGKAGFDAWKSSVGESPDFIDFVPAVPLAGIWLLCKTPEQSNFMKKHYEEKWAKEQSAACQLHADYVNSLCVITGESSSIQPPAGYTRIDYDLNAGAGGDFIYLCTHKVSYSPTGENAPGIVDLKVIYGKDTPPPAGYIKLPQDLNRGAKGEFIYLCVADRLKPRNSGEGIR